MSDLDNFLASVPSEDAPFVLTENEEQPETETSEEVASPEANQNEDTPSTTADEKSDEENVPFHKHPRWKEMYDSKKRLESEVETLREELDQRFEEVRRSVPQAPEQIPDRFVKLYGDDPEAYRLYQEQRREDLETLKAELREEARQANAQEEIALREGTRHVEDSLEALEAEGKSFDRNELMKFMLDFKDKYGALPTDDDDNIDFHRGYELMSAMKGSNAQASAKAKARKDLAAFSGSSGSGKADDSGRDYLTSNDMKNLDWDTLSGR